MLVCPGCGATTDDGTQRFCAACGMPLTPAGDPPEPTEEQQRARKVHAAYAEGDLVKVAWARNQPEAELIAGLLLEEGIPSVVRRARGFDVPDFLAAGPRDVLVASGGAEVARQALGGRGTPQTPAPPSLRGVALAMLIIVAASVAIAVVAAVLV